MADNQPSLRGIRTGVHPTYDRVVLDFSDGDRPTVNTAQVDELIADPSGEVEWLTGLTFTVVTIHGARNEGAYTGPLKFRTPGLVNVVAVAQIGDFEAVLSFGFGERRATVVSAQWLESPNRLAIDVAH